MVNFTSFMHFIKWCFIVVIFWDDVRSSVNQQSNDFVVVILCDVVERSVFKSSLSVHISSLMQQKFNDVSSLDIVARWRAVLSCLLLTSTGISSRNIRWTFLTSPSLAASRKLRTSCRLVSRYQRQIQGLFRMHKISRKKTLLESPFEQYCRLQAN